jgi:Fe-S-cluster-containing dehydrogenase component
MDREVKEDSAAEESLSRRELNPSFSRREFLRVSGIAVIGLSTFGALIDGAGGSAPLIIMDQAEGLVIGDPTKCVGCRRCELACTEFNDGKAWPELSRIKITRNLAYGPKGNYLGEREQGNFGGGLIVQDLCKQCPHPVPCADACPNDAIVLDSKTKARVVDAEKCIGCMLCQRACPWEMMSFDPEAKKATKCFLCGGNPKCVEACPAEAIRYVDWRDLTREIPPRMAPAVHASPAKAATCNDCHKK